MKLVRIIGTAFIMSALLVALSGCDRKEGPAEKVGKKIDQTTEQAGEQIEQAGESIQDAVKGDEK